MQQRATMNNGYNETMSYNELQYEMSYNGKCHYNKKTIIYNITVHCHNAKRLNFTMT